MLAHPLNNCVTYLLQCLATLCRCLSGKDEVDPILTAELFYQRFALQVNLASVMVYKPLLEAGECFFFCK